MDSTRYIDSNVLRASTLLAINPISGLKISENPSNTHDLWYNYFLCYLSINTTIRYGHRAIAAFELAIRIDDTIDTLSGSHLIIVGVRLINDAERPMPFIKPIEYQKNFVSSHDC